MTHCRNHFREGFSLAETAIVVTIIALVVGAIAGGTRMLRQTELKSVLVDYGQYANAVAQFRQQYGGWPGDLLDATTYWNSASGNGILTGVTFNGTSGTCTITTSGATNNKNSTCNGNTDGQIAKATEGYLAWQHLALANYVKGNFTGLADASGGASISTNSSIGNVPASRIKGAGWSFGYKDATPTSPGDDYTEGLGNYLVYGAQKSADITRGPILTPEEAQQIDSKQDDGKPYSGRIITQRSTAGGLAGCTNDNGTNATTLAAEIDDSYKISSNAKTCALFMSTTLR